jgi:hypothetical protein
MTPGRSAAKMQIFWSVVVLMYITVFMCAIVLFEGQADTHRTSKHQTYVRQRNRIHGSRHANHSVKLRIVPLQHYSIQDQIQRPWNASVAQDSNKSNVMQSLEHFNVSVEEAMNSNKQKQPGRKIVFCFPYNGEKHTVLKRLSQQPDALVVVSESLYGHNGALKKTLYWPLHFPNHNAQYVTLDKKVFEASSSDGIWAQETMTRRILGESVRNLYTRGEITDNDVVIVTDADEIISSAALSWLRIHLKHDELAVAAFRWFLFTHCYEHPRIVKLNTACTVRTLRMRFEWDSHKIRSTNQGMTLVDIPVKEMSEHCSWCFGNTQIREKMRLNIEGSSWQSRGPSYVFSNAELNHMRSMGLWFDGNVHGKRICTQRQIDTEMKMYDQ